MGNIKICVIGAGSWGKNHIKTLKSLNALSAIIDSDPSVRKEMKSQYNKIIVEGSIEESIMNRMDGIVIATPPSTHFKLAKQIISMGKPLLVEKPMVLSIDEAMQLNDHLDQEDGTLMVGHLLLFHPAILKMKSILDNGLLGDLQYIYSNRLNLGKVR